MSQVDYPPAIQALIAQFKRLPGIGPRSAERIAVWILHEDERYPQDLAAALTAASEQVRECEICGFYAAVDTGCPICSDHRRSREVICVVEQPTDVLPIERSGSFGGLYHVLGGRLSPLDGVGVDDLAIASLIDRAKDEAVSEVILALSSDVEGEATANYIGEMLGSAGGDRPLTVTRLAQGLPAGGGLEHADALTLSRALSGRREV